LGYDKLGGADPQAISNLNLILKETLACQVFSESTPAKVFSRKLALPKRIMLAGIDIDRLIDSAMHRKIGLPITVEVERCHMHTALHRILPDRCLHHPAVPGDFSRQTYADRNQLHDR